MKQTTENEYREAVRDLMYELHFAYHGIHTLPESHPARRVYERNKHLAAPRLPEEVAA